MPGIFTKVVASTVLMSVLSLLLFSTVLPHEANAAEIDNKIAEIRPLATQGCNGWNPFNLIKVNCLILNTLWLVNSFLAGTLLKLATSVFDLSLSYSLLNPAATFDFVKMGWKIVRDITNLFFIFILLWIALATIFGFPGYGVKDLLPKLIIAALLVNFSLAIGGFFINLTNALGEAFYTPIQGSVGDSLLKFTYFQIPATQQVSAASVASMSKESRHAACKQRADSLCKMSPIGSDIEKISCTSGDSSYFSCMNNASVAATAINNANEEAAFNGKVYDAIIQSLWLIVMIPILAFVFFAGAIFFLIRTLMLGFLMIFSPIIFLFSIMPLTRHYWTDWWNKLVQWSFFAPAFLFLLLITIKTFEQFSSQLTKAVNEPPQGLVSIGFQMILFTALMVMNITVAQRMGIMGAATVTAWGGRMSNFAQKQAKGVAYRGAIRGMEPASKALTESRVGRIMAQTPGLRALTAPALAIQERKDKLDEERAAKVSRAAVISPDLAVARLKGESAGVQAAFAKSASPEAMRRLMEKMPTAEREAWVATLNANRAKYRLDEGDLAKKVGDAMAKDPDGLTLRVIAKTGMSTADPVAFQNEVKKYLDGLNDSELNDALTAKAIATNQHALEYILGNFKNEQRIGRAVLGTPEKVKAFQDVVTATGGIPALANEMRSRGNAEGANALSSNLIVNVVQGGAIRTFINCPRGQTWNPVTGRCEAAPPPPQGGNPPPQQPQPPQGGPQGGNQPPPPMPPPQQPPQPQGGPQGNPPQQPPQARPPRPPRRPSPPPPAFIPPTRRPTAQYIPNEGQPPTAPSLQPPGDTPPTKTRNQQPQETNEERAARLKEMLEKFRKANPPDNPKTP